MPGWLHAKYRSLPVRTTHVPGLRERERAEQREAAMRHAGCNDPACAWKGMRFVAYDQTAPFRRCPDVPEDVGR